MGKKKTDKDVAITLEALQAYRKAHPHAKIDVHRYSDASIRIRIVDPDFGRKSLLERDLMVRDILRELPEDTSWQVTMVLLLTPEEKDEPWQMLNWEFEKSAKSGA
jgi:stress-induced morphogen